MKRSIGAVLLLAGLSSLSGAAHSACTPTAWPIKSKPVELWCMPSGPAQTRGYIPPDWQGSGTVSVSTSIGTNFWIDWTNTNPAGSAHTEFDISVSRDLSISIAEGYGQIPLSSFLSRNLTLTSSGKWERAPQGKAHIQAIIWLNKYQNSESKVPVGQVAIDITVVEWMDDRIRNNFKTNLPADTRYVTTVNNDGSDYRVYKREPPATMSEKVSYLAIREFKRDYQVAQYKRSSIDAAKFINAIRNADGKFDNSWYISSMGWEMTGATKDQSVPAVGNSSGKFNFKCYSIPSLRAVNGVTYPTGPGYNQCYDMS